MGFWYLSIAICAEVIGTMALKASDQFTSIIPSMLCIISYIVTFYFFSLVLKTVPIGIAYAIWAGLGIVLIAVMSAVLYRQMPDLPAILGMVLIVSGVVVINLFSKTVNH
ncbi:DMT family transporter [Psychromonas sp. PT13]|uniref:DMT family transporter n=1 Tax=Psychromonas sp. PT13 TaxID=3439547 RepID=UPI003EBD40B3